MKKIISRDNANFKLFKSLFNKRGRDKNKLFVIEGKKLLLEAISNKVNIKYIILNENFKIEDFVNLEEFEILILTEKLFSELTEMTNSEGIIGICEYLDDVDLSSENIFLLDNINDPGNFGTIIRTANAFGINDILVLNSVDKYNPKVLRATMGAIFRVNIKKISMDELKILSREYKIISTTLNEKSKNLEEIEFFGKNIIVMGNEANGVNDEILGISHEFLKIDMENSMESLNVSIATSLIMYKLFKSK